MKIDDILKFNPSENNNNKEDSLPPFRNIEPGKYEAKILSAQVDKRAFGNTKGINVTLDTIINSSVRIKFLNLFKFKITDDRQSEFKVKLPQIISVFNVDIKSPQLDIEAANVPELIDKLFNNKYFLSCIIGKSFYCAISKKEYIGKDGKIKNLYFISHPGISISSEPGLITAMPSLVAASGTTSPVNPLANNNSGPNKKIDDNLAKWLTQ